MRRQRLRAQIGGRPRGRSGNDDRRFSLPNTVREDARVGATLQPLPPGPFSAPGTPDYPEWQARTREFVNMTASGVGKEVTLLEMHDALFRTNSAVLLPEGEDPTKKDDDHSSLTTVGIVATLLRYNEEHPGKKMLIAGHCDTTNTPEFNQPLSEERAGVALALLVGDRQSFIDLCDKRHDEVDVTQILDWTTSAFGFSCKPTRLDAKPSNTRYHEFRTSYNAWVEAWDPAVEPDPRAPGKISQWGRLDTTVWGAIFDLYEYNLREELGEDGAGVAALRGKITWVDDSRKALGFSEYHPVDNLGRDGYRSQANRRVENLFFDEGEEPDMALAESAPEQSELYLPGVYERRHLGAMATGRRVHVRLCDSAGTPLPATDYTCTIAGGTILGKTDGGRWTSIPEPSTGDVLSLQWTSPVVGGSGSELLTRDVFARPTASDEGCRRRLLNLGYLGTELSELLEEFRGEFDWDQSVPLDVVRAELVRWHDGGARPIPATIKAAAESGNETPSTLGEQ